MFCIFSAIFLPLAFKLEVRGWDYVLLLLRCFSDFLKSWGMSPLPKTRFSFHQFLSRQHNKKVIIYYGVPEHAKGFANVMSGFGVKQPLRKALIHETIFYNNVSDIFYFFVERFRQNKKKHNVLLDKLYIEKGKIKQLAV